MRVAEKLLINILKELRVGDEPVKVPSWCRPHDVKQYWDRLDRDEELLMTEDDDGNIFVQVTDGSFSAVELRWMVLLALIAFWGVIGWLVAGIWG